MKIHTLRQLTRNSHHNAFTGARWFQGGLYVSFRQGDGHVCQQGRIVVLRSRDQGVSFDQAAVIRGQYDTRDAHLYQKDDRRLFVCGFEADEAKPVNIHAGCAYTDNGLNWSPWTRYTGCDGYVMWRPEYFRGKHYCAGYNYKEGYSQVAWFESLDGLAWKKIRVVHEGNDQPNECNLDFKPDGTAVMLMRREHASRKPLLCSAAAPYEKWTKIELDIPLAGPALWLVDDDAWISGRWFVTPQSTHVGVFKIENNRPVLKIVLPSGPGFDCSYMGVARQPGNRHRFALSYYSGHSTPDDPAVDPWSHPQIFLADASFAARFIDKWTVSDVVENLTAATAACPDPARQELKWRDVTSNGPDDYAPGFVDIHELIRGRTGVVYFVADIEVGPCDRGTLLLGYDGPVRVWLNGQQVFEGPGTNPATVDKTSLPVRFNHGANRVAIALDTHGGKAWGIYGRVEPEG